MIGEVCDLIEGLQSQDLIGCQVLEVSSQTLYGLAEEVGGVVHC